MAQQAMVVYYLGNSGYQYESISGADYYVEIDPPDASSNTNLFVVKAYYPNGKLKYTGRSSSRELSPMYAKPSPYFKVALQGPSTSLFVSGNKMSVRNYKDGMPVGEEINYYPNGKLYCTKTYTTDNKCLFIKCLDSAGNVLFDSGKGKWVDFDYSFKNYLTGDVVDGLPAGVWQGKQGDTTKARGTYKNGILNRLYSEDQSGVRTYILLDTVPQFRGGLVGFSNYLGRNIHYPKDAQMNNMQGKVIIGFICDTDGRLTDIKIVKSVSPSIDEESTRVLKASPKWTPGLVDGQPVRVTYSVPINFTLGQ